MDYNQLAVNILEAIGGSQNVENVSHCMTRLRFVMNDNAKVDMKKLQEINGVIRVIDTDTQLQIVIGSAVDKVYKEVCAVGNFESQEPVQQNADADKENKTKKKITPKSVANGIIDAVSGSLVPILPAIIAAGIFKMVAVLLGPTNLGVFTEDNQLYIFCNLVNTAVFYFLPFFIAYTASKKFNATPLYAMMVVAVMIHPDMLDIINAGETFKLYGIFNMQLINYTSSVIPIVLSTWVISYIEKFVKKIVPDHFRVVGVPVLIMVLAFPAALCICGPACNAIMQLLVNVILWMNDTLGIVAIVIVAVFWLFLMMFGMHMPLMMTLLPVWMQMGYDAIVSPGAIASSLAHVGAILSYAIRANNQDKRAFYDRWKNPGDRAKYKAINLTGSTQMSSRFVEDDNTLTLESFRVGYEFDSAAIAKFGLKALRVNAYMNDVFKISSIKTERGTEYPFARSFSLSVSASF